MTIDSLAMLFAAIALGIALLTGKRLALVSSVFFFTVAFIDNLQYYESMVLSMVLLAFAMFSIAVMEFRRTHYPLPRSLSWLYAGMVLVSGSYAFDATAVQGHILIAMSVIELILLASLEGCRNVWADISSTVRSIRNRNISAHSIDSGEGGA